MEALSNLFDGLEGLQLVIPSKSALDPGWACSHNPHQESISQDLTDWVQKWYERKICRKIAHTGVVMLASMAFPRATLEALLAIAQWMAWNVPWDDAIDDDANSSIRTGDLIRYRDDTIKVVQSSLSAQAQEETLRHPDPRIESYREVGMAIGSCGDAESNRDFMIEQCIWIASATQSHVERQGGTPVTTEEYFQRRQVSIGVRPLMGLMYHAYKIKLPSKYTYRNNIPMQIIRSELPIMEAIVNDLVSLQKETKAGVFDSLVPILMYNEALEPQAAIERAKEMLHESYERFRKAEGELYEQTGADDLAVVKAYVLGCKNLVVANLNWSFSIKRYMGQSSVQADGSIVFELSLPESISS